MSILDQAKQAAEDHTETKAGFNQELPTAGRVAGRFIAYVETGVHPQGEYQGKPKPPCEEVELTFEVHGGENTSEITDDNGATIKVGRKLYVRIPKKLNDKSKFVKYFKGMQAGRDNIKNMASMLDEVFMLDIVHTKGKNDKTYANLDKISAPIVDIQDPLTGISTGEKRDISGSIPPATVPHKLLLQDKPTIEQWKSIEITGTYKAKQKDENGKEIEVEKSKNFLQERIMASESFKGSPLELLLSGFKEDFTPPKEETKTVPVVKDAPVTDNLLEGLGL